jgi:hypothetical protein
MLPCTRSIGHNSPPTTMSPLPGKVKLVQPPGQSCIEEGHPLLDERYRSSPTRYFTVHTFASYTVVIYIYIYEAFTTNKKRRIIFPTNLTLRIFFLFLFQIQMSNPAFLLPLFQFQFPKVIGNCVNKQLKTLFREKKNILHKQPFFKK